MCDPQILEVVRVPERAADLARDVNVTAAGMRTRCVPARL
jgi:hypothetical protein